jgi:hypothetical protein
VKSDTEKNVTRLKLRSLFKAPLCELLNLFIISS